jgi:purine-nucleoside phosphorylase
MAGEAQFHSIYEKIQDAARVVRESSSLPPKLGFVLGNNLTGLVDILSDKVEIPYSEIPHIDGQSVEGKAGRLFTGTIQDVPVVLLDGRFHFYEGYSMDEVVFPVRVLCSLGIRKLVLTNTAGAVNTRYAPGDIMLITDHINLMGDNPLRGGSLRELGPRFPDMSQVYCDHSREVISSEAKRRSLEIREGVYAGLVGPIYETPAEVRMLRTLGADVVGMSTVPEAIAASHLGVQALGVTAITNYAAGMVSERLASSTIKAIAKESTTKLIEIFDASVPDLMGRAPHQSTSPTLDQLIGAEPTAPANP